jgi:hypothetical protein
MPRWRWLEIHNLTGGKNESFPLKQQDTYEDYKLIIISFHIYAYGIYRILRPGLRSIPTKPVDLTHKLFQLKGVSE